MDTDLWRSLVPAGLGCIVETVGDLGHALIPLVVESHPLSCHEPRRADAIVFDKLVQVLLLGAAYGMVRWHHVIDHPRLPPV